MESGEADRAPTDSSRAESSDAWVAGRTDEETPADAPDIGLDEVFEILKNRRRRRVLRRLTPETEQMQLGDLAEQIAARECDKDVSQINSSERKRVYVGLYQCHLPKMADTGAIDYNKPRGTIARGPNFDQFRHYLPDSEDPAEHETGTQHGMLSITGLIK